MYFTCYDVSCKMTISYIIILKLLTHIIVYFSWVPVIDFVESKYEEFLNAESRVSRKVMPDSRVHCCLYFIAPSGHGLKPLDVEFMQRLSDKVNIIPIIAKADTMTPEECAQFKKQASSIFNYQFGFNVDIFSQKGVIHTYIGYM